MVKKLFVGGFLYATKEEELRDAFAQCGEVISVALINKPGTREPAGYGFVEMANEEDAVKAIEMWNEKEFMGRKLTVNEARPKQPKPSHEGRQGDFS